LIAKSSWHQTHSEIDDEIQCHWLVFCKTCVYKQLRLLDLSIICYQTMLREICSVFAANLSLTLYRLCPYFAANVLSNQRCAALAWFSPIYRQSAWCKFYSILSLIHCYMHLLICHVNIFARILRLIYSKLCQQIFCISAFYWRHLIELKII